MEIKLNKEIRDYKESIFFGLSLRQLIFSFMAVASAVGVYFGLRSHCGAEVLSWLCVAAAVPFAIMGFGSYNGMSPERFLLVWLRFVFEPKILLYEGRNVWYEELKG